MSELPDYEYIDNQDALEAFCKAIRGKPWLIVDTEFMRERTYRPELCLVQIKHGEHLALIDTIALTSLDPLLEVLRDERTVKVFHAASQDLEIFHLLLDEVPGPLFDTQLAAPLLGYNEQIGYANLVREHLGIELPKNHTRTDWSSRPLSDGQKHYALEDVIHLESLYMSLREELERLGRLAWLDGEFEALRDPKRYDQPADERWLKIRQIERYKGPALGIIQALARWREIKAREFNRPRNWIMKDDAIVNLARQAPTSLAALGQVRGLDKSLVKRHGEELVALIVEAREKPPKPFPKRERKKKLTPQRLAQSQLMKALVHQRAAELDIAPSLLGPDKLLDGLARGSDIDTLGSWRAALIGEELDALRRGERALKASDQGLVLLPLDS